jgi:transaldolase
MNSIYKEIEMNFKPAKESEMQNLKSKPGLRLYIDSPDAAIWQHYLSSGLFYGVTTNPKLLYQAGIANTVENLAGLAQEAFDLGAQEIHLQTWGGEVEPMLATGRQLAAIDARVSVKVPITEEGLLCARQLIEEGAKVTLTAVHASVQMLPVVALGAAYAAPYLGRMNDGGLDGLDEIAAMQQIIHNLGGSTRLLVASIRSLSDLAALARLGCDTFTLLPGLVEELLSNPQTLAATADFEEKAAGALDR